MLVLVECLVLDGNALGAKKWLQPDDGMVKAVAEPLPLTTMLIDRKAKMNIIVSICRCRSCYLSVPVVLFLDL